VSQASNTTSGPPPLGLPAAIQPRMDPLQSLFTDPAVVSVDKQPQSTGPMPPLPVAAKAASDLESDLKPTKAKKAGHAAKQMVQQQQQPAPMETTAAPQLMSPMVFAGQGQDHQPSPGPAAVPVRPPPMGLPVITPVSLPVSMPMPLINPPVMPFNGVPAFHMPVHVPQVAPLTEAQLTQAFQHLLQTDRGFVTKIHQAYVESLNTQLN